LCALTYFTYRIDMLLESNPFVHCVFAEFNKTFDTVDNEILIKKLCMAHFPTFILILIILFLTDRLPATLFLGNHLL
jgi:hypothetical protein